MSTALKELLDLPNLPQLVEKARQYLQEEALRREQFYNDIDETVKAEFINGEAIILEGEEEEYHLHGRKEMGDEITSHAIPGFKIPVSAIFSASANLAALQGMQGA
jgi:hypothetical protein